MSNLPRLIPLLLLFLLATPPAVQSQETPRERAQALFNRGIEIYRSDGAARVTEAAALMREASEIMEAAGELATAGKLIRTTGVMLEAAGRPDSALAYYAMALELQREVGDRADEAVTIRYRGDAHAAAGRFEEALAWYRDALAIQESLDDPRARALTHDRMAVAHARLDRPDSALVRYASALTLVREAGDPAAEGAVLSSLAGMHADLGRPDSALVFYQRALELRRQEEDRRGEAVTLNGIAFTHGFLGRPDSARIYYMEALAIRREVGDRAGESVTLDHLGMIQDDLGHPDSAVVYHRRALEIAREVGNPSAVGRVLANLGAAFGKLDQADSALVYVTQALGVRREAGDLQGQATMLSNIGTIHADLGRPDSAFLYLRQALAAARAASDPLQEMITLSMIANTHRLHPSSPDPARATAYYDSAAIALSRMSESAGGDQNRLAFAEQDVELFAKWALAWLARSPEVGERAAALGALAAAERGRSQALLSLMRENADAAAMEVAMPQPGANLVEEGRRLVAGATAQGAAVLSYLVTPDTLVAVLALPDGGVHSHRRAVSGADLASAVHRLRTSLAVDSAAVRSRMVSRDAPPLEEPEQRGIGLGLGIEAGGDWIAHARQLADLLLPAELAARLPASAEIVVIPHGAANLVPFAALPLSTGEPLGARYPLRYAPSLTTLAEARARPATSRADGALVVGNPEMPVVEGYTGERMRLSPLPGAEEEGRWVARRLGVAGVTGPEATEERVRRLLPSAPVVHLATHGYAYSSDTRARDSFIALAPDAQHDGLLTVGEVIDELPTLSADLVVLSACQTGLGDLKQAEGTVGLQRAFLARGARSVLVSLWSVSDEATERLMRSFYAHWLEDADTPSKAEALRRAQEEVRTDPSRPEWSHPRFWAAFQMVGAR